MKQFDINTETAAAENFKFSGEQESKFQHFNCERVFRFRYVAGIENLPKYIRVEIRTAGYVPRYLGGTTYKYSVIGLQKITPATEREELESVWWGVGNLRYLKNRCAEAFSLFPELTPEYAPKLIALEMEAAK